LGEEQKEEGALQQSPYGCCEVGMETQVDERPGAAPDKGLGSEPQR